MEKLCGLNYPFIFNANKSSVVCGKPSNVFNKEYSEEVAKVRADLNLIIRQEINKLLMRPDIGVGWNSILFVSDVRVTRDFVYTFVMEAVEKSVPDVMLKEVYVVPEASLLKIGLVFVYLRSDIGFTLEYMVGGMMNG